MVVSARNPNDLPTPIQDLREQHYGKQHEHRHPREQRPGDLKGPHNRSGARRHSEQPRNTQHAQSPEEVQVPIRRSLRSGDAQPEHDPKRRDGDKVDSVP